MVSKDLTFIHIGNKTKVDDLINFEKLRMLAKEIRGLMNMCSASLDIFNLMESRAGGTDLNTMKNMNTATMKTKGSTSALHGKKGRENLNPRRMHEEAQMVRKVKAYLSQRPVIVNEDELMQLSLKCEPDPHVGKSMSSQPSTTSIMSTVSRTSVWKCHDYSVTQI